MSDQDWRVSWDAHGLDLMRLEPFARLWYPVWAPTEWKVYAASTGWVALAQRLQDHPPSAPSDTGHTGATAPRSRRTIA